MKRRTHWFLLFLAFTLGILSVSAQNRANSRLPPRDPVASRPTPESARVTDPVFTDDQHGALRIVAESRQAVRSWDSRIVAMQRTEDLRLRKVQDDTQMPGRWHERLEQYYKDVPLFGGDIVRESNASATLTIYGTVYAGISMDVRPTLSAGEAVAVFERETGEAAGVTLQPELMILPKDDGSFVLVYRTTQFTGNALPVVFVNAQTGAVEFRYDNLQTQAVAWRGKGVFGDEKKVSGLLQTGRYATRDQMRPPVLDTFDLLGNLTRVKSILNGVIAPSTTSDIANHAENYWTDGAAVDGHSYLGWTYDYLFKRFGRRGLDDNNTPIRAIVHPARPEDTPTMTSSDYGLYLVNAFWCGGCGTDRLGYMVFGDGNRTGYYDAGSGQHFEPFAGAIDVVAHELTHGMTSYTSRLAYVNESGALNEAFSDIIGTSVEFYFQPVGSGSQKADYLLGEDIALAARSGTTNGSRSMADPGAFGDPDHYSKRYTGTSDNGGVHTNSGIANHAFYLAIEGGTNRTSGLSVQGVGAANRAQIERVFYRAFVYYLTSNATFSTARAATIRAAQELYGVGSAADRAITQAWTAVGVS